MGLWDQSGSFFEEARALAQVSKKYQNSSLKKESPLSAVTAGRKHVGTVRCSIAVYGWVDNSRVPGSIPGAVRILPIVRSIFHFFDGLSKIEFLAVPMPYLMLK